jgi:ribosomal protein S18 acetylase RimI-like enzyme
VRIRPFEERDWPQLWLILEAAIRAGDTFCYDPLQTEAQARDMWVVAAPGAVVVAVQDGVVVGSSNMYANRPGPGSHISSGNVVVGESARGHGVGRTLVEHLLTWSRDQGFVGVQFNAVAASNTPAVSLYQRVGFVTVGTVPRAFAHPTLGLVGLHVMFHDLAGPSQPGD